MTTIVQSAMTAAVPAPDLSSVENGISSVETQLAVQNLRSVINNNSSYIRAVDAIADEFSDATGIDATASLNETYDASGDFYSNAGAGTSTVNAIPDMTSNTAPSGVASATGGGSDAYVLYDRAYSIFAFGSPYGFVKYDFGSGNGKVIKQYKIGARNDYTDSAPRAWTFQGSNDDSTWTTIDTQSGQSFSGGQLKVYNVSNSTNYRYYRNNFTQTNGHSNMTWNSIEMYAALPPVNMTIISSTFTAETAPSESSAVFLHQPVDSVTINTDILGYISRDAGTTWSQGTLVDAGSFDSTTNILTMNAVDISAQPSGTSMRYKIVTANTKEQRLHGAWLAWS